MGKDDKGGSNTILNIKRGRFELCGPAGELTVNYAADDLQFEECKLKTSVKNSEEFYQKMVINENQDSFGEDALDFSNIGSRYIELTDLVLTVEINRTSVQIAVIALMTQAVAANCTRGMLNFKL